ncbi:MULTISPECIES: tRNA (N6-threonylcarbamoyladenosine(37)-N6)-methyltransferase TrmO [unclassified Neisseria]|uniref:tRNA (N6-threonylcarbamoyladenosine(37)-N6)-methyltransferase TrmO n=1 Tax=unclassified Neisseria TaxID=2623750 RepID=UPI002665A977|nr:MULTISPECIES: tRNA (N6-threonylcarbamoyladenosine(37)-N6)-methyltransferase TrmO [unclassified Neisseria]MDO1509679.1 tRNA (N6-threonylcarbamoyladenosine(37)-N6)-methyltransferase TrmO [Neisseria sp. MVDL19-042950]MDO1515997.1 tRNA (N6-threonylcarbamoyladenosine(37)-N6)-methyltransferase TrmO [Neisseria sp. MVDL18-041461]MDO1563110.1 tRNA (N6-threonylcarbamoyladenosine(37)-N6)-methyltransferase TrmO [Neisseria sp. MVDL20-010259]
MQHTVYSIATVHSPYKQKFGVARQPGLVPAAEVCIELNREFTADSIRGLDTFDYVWISFIFHDVINEGWSPLVRPPRLGGKQKMGVFATRSPHRPNHIGLSLLKLERIETGKTVRLYCSGADLLDDTPVIDIKPYIPFVEAKPDAAGGFAAEKPEELTVNWLPDSGADNLAAAEREVIAQSIAQDPRPAYQDIPERIYVMAICNYEVKFQIQGKNATIISIVESMPD